MEGRSGLSTPGVRALVFRLSALGHWPSAELAAVATSPSFRRQSLEELRACDSRRRRIIVENFVDKSLVKKFGVKVAT